MLFCQLQGDLWMLPIIEIIEKETRFDKGRGVKSSTFLTVKKVNICIFYIRDASAVASQLEGPGFDSR